MPRRPLNSTMGRHRTSFHWLWNSGREVRSCSYDEIETLHRWELMHRCPYSEMVGARIRRMRTTRGLTQTGLLDLVEKPRGGTYSQGFLSRIEKGYTSAPLYAYVHLAQAFEVEPGRMMGSDETQKPLTEAEMTLIRFIRRMKIAPDEAIVRLATQGP